MNGHGVTLTSFIVTICNVLYKPARKYLGKLLFGALMRPGTISSWLRGHAEGLAKRMYEQLTRIGLKDESLQNAYALWLVKSLELHKDAEIKLIVDDTPIKRYGKKVQRVGHHNPTDKTNANSCCYGRPLVMISIVVGRPRWKTRSTPAEEVIKQYALRFSIEELFKDLKQDCGLGLQQTRRYEWSLASASIVIAGYSLVEVWSFDQDENELKSLRNVWDDMEHRPSHREKLCAIRKNSRGNFISNNIPIALTVIY